MSLSVPEPSWRQWSREAATDRRTNGAARRGRGGIDGDGEPNGGTACRRTARATGIDPRLFRLFRIGSVPAVAVVPGGVPPCTSPGCSSDPPPPHDLVTGNIGLAGALEAITTDGRPGRETAMRYLAVLRGEMN